MVKSRLGKNTVILSLGTMMTKGINLVMIPLFSSWLSTEDYGEFDVLCTYIALLLPFITVSISDAMFRFSADKEQIEEKQRYITSGLVVYIINSLVSTIVIGVFSLFTKWEFGVAFICLLIAEILNSYLQGFVRAIKKLELYSIFNIITTCGIALFVTLFVAVIDLGLCGIIYGYTAGYIVGSLFLLLTTRFWRYIKFTFLNKTDLKEMLKYSIPLIPNNISWWAINASDRLLINWFLGPVANGIYAISSKVPNFCASIFNVFSISWQEAAVELSDFNKRNEYYNKVYNKTLSTMISLCAGLLSINVFLFKYIFEDRYFSASLYSPILISAILFSSMTQYFGGIQISLKRTRHNGMTTVVGAVINLIVNVCLIKFAGLYTAAISTLLANVVVCILRFLNLHKEVRFRLKKSTVIHCMYYLYMFFSGCFFKNGIILYINFGVAITMFLVINYDFVKPVILKIKTMR